MPKVGKGMKGKKKKGKKGRKKKGALPPVPAREITEFKPSVHETPQEVQELMAACQAGNYELVHELILEQAIDERVDFVNAVDEKGECAGIYCLTSTIKPLIGWSASSNPPETVLKIFQLLLDYGMDPNHQDNQRNSLLHCVCNFDMAIGKPFIRVLVGLKANIMAKNKPPGEATVDMFHSNPQKMRKFLGEVKEEVDEIYDQKERTFVTKEQRSYFKSMYDVLDVERLQVLRPDTLTPLLEQENPVIANTFLFPELEDARSFFCDLDHNKNGFLDFEEWVRSCHIFFEKAAKEDRKKNKKKKKGKKKKKKK